MTGFNDELIMLEKFPLLIPCNFKRSWKGYILIHMQNIEMEISCPNYPQLENLNVDINQCNNFNFHIFDIEELVKVISDKTNSLSEFLINLISELTKAGKPNIFSKFNNLIDVYPFETFYDLIKEIHSYSQYVHTIEKDLKHITFNVLDVHKRNHLIKTYIPIEYVMTKKQPLRFETKIPIVAVNSLVKINTVSKLLDEFICIVYELNAFWNVHQEIIQTCNVIGQYNYNDVTYKVPIDCDVYVEIEINPYNPKNCPKFSIHGQQEFAEKFQQILNEIDPIIIWNSENSFKENILNVFNIRTLPLQYKENIQDLVEESPDNVQYCFICYDNLDTTKMKQIKTCNNKKCDALYHMLCICEWLLNSGSTPMFEHLQGKCPQCEEDMLVALDNFDHIKT